jgi:glucose/arabinose dehydrogenase
MDARRSLICLVTVAALCLIAGCGQDADVMRQADGREVVQASPADFGAYTTRIAFPNLTFRRPIEVVAPPDGSDRLFAIEQHGVVTYFENKRDVAGKSVCLDISAKVRRRGNEEGLLGIAFHPEFKTNRYMFLHYSASDPRRNVVSRFTLDEKREKADPDSEFVILELEQPFSNHNGGYVGFGPDGYLYITFGDGGYANDPYDHSQNLGNWFGTVLRIDIDKKADGNNYAIPDDNPFADRDEHPTTKPEIWAYGLRNLWRMAYDPESKLWIGGDVGQNRIEEIDIIESGKNYGWRAYEGTNKFMGPARGRPAHEGPFVNPLVQYTHNLGQSVTGGYIYRGAKLPKLVGKYIYGDYESGRIWALEIDYDKKTAKQQRQIGILRGVAGFGIDADRNLYACVFARRGGDSDGRIYEFVEAEADGEGDDE